MEELTLTNEQNKATKEMLIEQECGCQNYGITEIKIKCKENNNPESGLLKRCLEFCNIVLETQHKKAVHTFMLWDIPSEASPGRLKRKREFIDTKDKEDLKALKELFETDLNIQLGALNENTNEEDLTRLCKKWANNVYCILRQQLRSKKQALQNNWVKKAKEVGEFIVEIPLESLDKEKNQVQVTGDKPHIDSLQVVVIKMKKN
ncbi:23133_t:CDS:2 [Gigaspora rosea]|nr:23133_t:CDS:2 [Gigaspora rosea]